ncbi:hypothetical protein T01_8564, partial [Trichinella spiralis]
MKIDGVHRKQNPLGCATPEQSTKALRKRGKNLDRRRQWFANFSGLRPTLDYYKRKMLDNCSLFRNLVLIPIIAINPILHMYEVVKESSTFNAAVERVGY